MAPSEPVFVDSSGRRRGVLRLLGAIFAVVLAVGLVVIGIGFATGSGVPGTPWSAGTGRSDPSGPARPQKVGDRGAGSAGRATASAGPRATAPGAAPAPGRTTARTPAAPATSATGAATSSAPAATATAHGKSTKTPPAYGRTKKPAA